MIYTKSIYNSSWATIKVSEHAGKAAVQGLALLRSKSAGRPQSSCCTAPSTTTKAPMRIALKKKNKKDCTWLSPPPLKKTTLPSNKRTKEANGYSNYAAVVIGCLLSVTEDWIGIFAVKRRFRFTHKGVFFLQKFQAETPAQRSHFHVFLNGSTIAVCSFQLTVRFLKAAVKKERWSKRPVVCWNPKLPA